MTQEPFNPLSVANVGVTLAVELLLQPAYPVPPKPFPGAGVYALYYVGDWLPYRPLVERNRKKLTAPIYVGSATREGTKKGFKSRPEQRERLHERIDKHAKSIAATELKLQHFRCRYLVLDDAFILLAESVLIAVFRPIWNGMGLGSNPVGRPRMAGRASPWDTLHPGRKNRPAASPENQKAALHALTQQLETLKHRPSDDKELARMYERIMRYV